MGAHLRRKPWTGVDVLSPWTVDATAWPVVQFCISFCFFLVEVVASRVTGSLLLLSSAFQTLEGALTLAVSLADIWLASGRYLSRRNTFGWARVRITGTLVSAVFQSALYLTIIPESILRVAAPQITEHASALMGIGAMGIPIHLARAWLNERQSQDGGPRPCCSRRRITQADSSFQETEDLLESGSSMNRWPWVAELSPMVLADKPGQLRLDWMVACLGPISVLLYSVTYYLLVQTTPCVSHTACFGHCLTCSIWNTSEHTQLPCWLLYLDPGFAVVVAVTLLCIAWPALRVCFLVHLQAVPDQLDLHLLEQHLRATEGVAAVRDLNIWQLDGPTSLVASAHVCCLDMAKYETVINNVQQVFCEHGIHATTVQPHLDTCSNGTHHEKCDVPPLQEVPDRQSC
ncbi:zinc transporter 1-like [Sceloporus undulatus]|uniref:zinc transporter 1-like n=1 Tax=Sceloporus undulatus TaxID=8520 RepID=UPI001C4A8D08|nr:zinc transporter 1-like [Sceloporus undulatus]XP_042295155.1 zinc transporter 1-like [Sceloporus undulatus]